MKELKADLFEVIYEKGVDAICITTNAHYTLDGRAAMGGGCAGVCAKRWPETSFRLGRCLKNFGTNIPFVIGALDDRGNHVEPNMKMIKARTYKCLIISFPTINNLMDGANLELIENSAKELRILTDRFELRGVHIGRPGVGIGGLRWADVKPVLEKHFDDRFTILSFEHEE
jgi:hypothetical protein